MKPRFLIDNARVRQLAATRQGRISLGGFAYQVAYAVARMASLYMRRPLLDLEDIPLLLRFDWAEDLDEIGTGGSVVLTQCKRIEDIGRAGNLAEVLLGFAPKWLWTPQDSRAGLRFRLVCPDTHFVGCGPTPLSSYRPASGKSDREAVLAAALAQLKVPAGPRSDRALWQSDAEAFGLERLCEEIWEQTEVLYLRPDCLVDDPAGPLFAAEREALALLVRMQAVAPTQQRQALVALRALIHANVIAFDPSGTLPVPPLDHEPQVVGFDDINYSLFEFQGPPEERVPFQVVTRQFLDIVAAKPKEPFVARRPRWADVVHGQDAEIRFLERELTQQVFSQVRDKLLGNIGIGEALPLLFVLGAPGAGKSTLVLRVAASLVQAGLAVVAAPKLNLDRIEEDEIEPFLQALARLEEGSLPVILVLDDPFFADSGWEDLLRRLAKRSRQVAVLGASPEYLFREFGHTLAAGRQVDCRTVVLSSPSKTERRALAILHGRNPQSFEKRDEDFLVLAMEASAGVSFGTIIDRIWVTLNQGLPINPSLRPNDLPWPVRAYLVACYFHRFYLRCSEILMNAVLSLTGSDQPPGGFTYELRRLVNEQGWSIFSITELTGWQRFLGFQIGAGHAGIASEAWQRRPVPAFDVGQWVLASSVDAQAAATEIGSLASHLAQEVRSIEVGFLPQLTSLWNLAAKEGRIETRDLCLLHEALRLQAGPAAAHYLRPGLEACVARRDEQSWLSFLALILDWGSIGEALKRLGSHFDFLALIHVANFHIAPYRADQFLSQMKDQPAAYEASVVRILNTSNQPQAHRLLTATVKDNPADETIRRGALEWIRENSDHPQVHRLLTALVKANPADEAIQQSAFEWIWRNPDHFQVFWLIKPLVVSSATNTAIRYRALEWIVGNPSHPQRLNLLGRIGGANPRDKFIRQLIFKWVRENPGDSRAYYLLKSLIEANAEDDDFLCGALEWIRENPGNPGAYKLLRRLAAANPEAAWQDALAWIQIHPTKSYTLLKCLDKSLLGKKAIRDSFLQWAQENSDHSQWTRILKYFIVEARDERFQGLALGWIRDHSNHPEMFRLLSALIVSSNGSEEILRLGIEIARDHRQPGRASIIAALLKMKLNHQCIEIAIDYLNLQAGRSNKHIFWLLTEVSNQHLSNMLAYVAQCRDESRKRTALQSIAYGIARKPQMLRELLSEQIDELSPEDANYLTVRLLDRGIKSEELIWFIAVRLARNFRRKGYGFILRAVQRHTAARSALLSLQQLDPRVRADLLADSQRQPESS